MNAFCFASTPLTHHARGMSETDTIEYGGLTTITAATTRTSIAADTTTTITTGATTIATATGNKLWLLLPHVLLAACILLLLFVDFLLYRRRISEQVKKLLEKQEVQETYPSKRVAGGLHRNVANCGPKANAVPKVPVPDATVVMMSRSGAKTASVKSFPFITSGAILPREGGGEGFSADANKLHLQPNATKMPLFSTSEDDDDDLSGDSQENETGSSPPVTPAKHTSPSPPSSLPPPTLPSSSPSILSQQPPHPQWETTPTTPRSVSENAGKQHQQRARHKLPHARGRKLSVDEPDAADLHRKKDSAQSEVNSASLATYATKTTGTLSAQPAQGVCMTTVAEAAEDRRPTARRNSKQNIPTTVLPTIKAAQIKAVEAAEAENTLNSDCVTDNNGPSILNESEESETRKTTKPKKKQRKLLERLGLQPRNEMTSQPGTYNPPSSDSVEPATADVITPSGIDLIGRRRESSSSQRHLERRESQLSDKLPPIFTFQTPSKNLVCKKDEKNVVGPH